MFSRPCLRLYPLLFASVIFVALSLPEVVRGVIIDQNSNGMSDIWELVYGANGIDPNADSDGDGVPNILEAIAGTDPFDPTSVPKISFSAVAGTNFAVTIPSALGKQYVLESATPVAGGNWTNWTAEASVIARSGSSVTLTNPATILSFAVVFAGLGLAGGTTAVAALTVAGVFAGSALWWLALSTGVGLLRARFTPGALRWVNRLSGAVLVGFGLFALATVGR